LFELKKVYQYIKFSAPDLSKGKIEIKNIYDFTNLNEFDFSWKLLKNGTEVSKGDLDTIDLEPSQSKVITIKIPKLKGAKSDYHLNIYAKKK